MASDGDYLQEFLCYQDSSFGLKQFGAKSCDYELAVSLEKIYNTNYAFKLYPIPTNDYLQIETNSVEVFDINFTDISGREIKKIKLEQNSKISVSELENGIYLITITKGTEKIYATNL